MRYRAILLAALLFVACFIGTYAATPGPVVSSPQALKMRLNTNVKDIQMKSASFQFSFAHASFAVEREMEYTLTALTKLDVWSPRSSGPTLTMWPEEKIRLRYLAFDTVRASLMELVGTDSDLVLSESAGSLSATIEKPDSVKIKIKYVYPHSDSIQLWLGTGATIEIDREPNSIYSAYVTPDDRLSSVDMAEVANFRLDGSVATGKLELRLKGLEGNMTAFKELEITSGQGFLEADRRYDIYVGNTVFIAQVESALLTVARVDSGIQVASDIFVGYASIDGSAVPKATDWSRILVSAVAGFFVALIPLYLDRGRLANHGKG